MANMGLLCLGNSLWHVTGVTNSVCDHGGVSSSLDFGFPMNSTGIWMRWGAGVVLHRPFQLWESKVQWYLFFSKRQYDRVIKGSSLNNVSSLQAQKRRDQESNAQTPAEAQPVTGRSDPAAKGLRCPEEPIFPTEESAAASPDEQRMGMRAFVDRSPTFPWSARNY